MGRFESKTTGAATKSGNRPDFTEAVAPVNTENKKDRTYAAVVIVEPAKTREVIDRLDITSGAAAREVLKPYDVAIELEAGAPEDLTAILRHPIRPAQVVTNTVTCPWFTTNT